MPGGPLIEEMDDQTTVQERKLAQSGGEYVVVEIDVLEDLVAGLEGDLGAGLVRIPDRFEGSDRVSFLVQLMPDMPIAMDGQVQGFGQRIHDRDADAVQSTRNLVGVLVELTAGVQHGHDDLRCRNPLLRVDVHRDAAAVIADRHGGIRMYPHRHFGAVACQGFIDAVVDNLEHHVVQTGTVIGITDVHAGPLTDGIESFQDLDIGGIVGRHRKSSSGRSGRHNLSAFHVEPSLVSGWQALQQRRGFDRRDEGLAVAGKQQ